MNAPASIGDLIKTLGLELGENPSADAIQASLQRVQLLRQNGVDPLIEEQLGSEARRRWKGAGVDRPKALWDSTAPQREGAILPAGSGTAVTPRDPKPWPEPVDGARLLDDLVEWFARYLYLPRGALEAIALWVVATWFVESLHFAPPLLVVSPTKRAGKTLLMDLLSQVVRRAVATSGVGVTPAIVFRLNEALRPTFLIDEAEKLASVEGAAELIGLLNNGYRRGGNVYRCVGESREPRGFDVFGFRALASIRRLFDTIEDRAILIPMARKPPDVHLDRFSSREAERQGELLGQRLARYAQDHGERAGSAEEEAPRPQWLNDRACDSWGPLFAVAALAGAAWPDRAQKAARVLSVREPDSDQGERLLQDLGHVFASRGRPEVLSSEEVCHALNSLDESPWGELAGGRGTNPHKLAALLRPFGLKPAQRRTATGEKVRGWWLRELMPVLERYGAGDTPTPSGEAGQVGHPSLLAMSPGAQPGTGLPGCPTSEDPGKSGGTDAVPHVPLSERGWGGGNPDLSDDGYYLAMEREGIQLESRGAFDGELP